MLRTFIFNHLSQDTGNPEKFSREARNPEKLETFAVSYAAERSTKIAPVTKPLLESILNMLYHSQ